MGDKSNTVIVYSAQTSTVIDVLNRDGVCYSKREYVLKKYEDTAKVFTTVYDAFVSEAVKYVPKPEGADYPYWAFTDLYNVDTTGADVLKLCVPTDELIFFDMYDFTKMLNQSYMGEDEKDEQTFIKKVTECGVKNISDITLTSFYPLLKREVLASWKRLFRHHEAIKSGDSDVKNVQVGLWRIKKEWIVG